MKTPLHPLVLAGFLTCCDGPPPSPLPTPSTPPASTPVCTAGTDVEVEGFRLDAAEYCFDYVLIPGECEAMTPYLEGYQADPPVLPCTPEEFTFTELATGDCLRLSTRCPGVLDDPRYGDCTLADEETCCAIGEQQVHPGVCDDP